MCWYIRWFNSWPFWLPLKGLKDQRFAKTRLSRLSNALCIPLHNNKMAETRKDNWRFTDILVFHLFWHTPFWTMYIYIYITHHCWDVFITYFQKKNSLAHCCMAPNFHHLHLPTKTITCAKTPKCCANRPWTESGRRMHRSYPLNLRTVPWSGLVVLDLRPFQCLEESCRSNLLKRGGAKLDLYHGKVKIHLKQIQVVGDTLETKIALYTLQKNMMYVDYLDI